MKSHRSTFGLVLTALLFGCSDGTDTIYPPSSLTVVSTAAPEGAAGTMSQLAFRVTMTGPQPQRVLVQYNTEPVSATAETDFLPTTGELEIPAGAIEGTIYVDLIGDAEEENAETFLLNFGTSGNVTATSLEAMGTIANDDTLCDTPFSKDPNPWLRHGEDPLNFAHRGGVTDFPENTLYAYAEAAKAGADVLEMDIYQTADNELVVLHDLSVNGTTDGTGNVVDLTLAELRALDAAYWFVPDVGTPHDRPEEDYPFRGIASGNVPPPAGYSAEDFRIPTLEEALQRFPHNLINLELKPDLDGAGDYEGQMADLLVRYGRFTDLIAVSFVDAAAKKFKAKAPCIYTAVPLDQGTTLVLGALGEGVMPPVPEHISFQVPPDTSQIGPQIPDDFFLEVVTADFISDSHAVNLAVQVWTVNSCEEMLRMIDLGVDGIMTDKPLLLASILSTPPEERSCP
ncbi:MAG: glycerophosphoryl diester phosphodiesterase [Halioglobus sp.]|jgi:glycerophosphoryl diester phosphodiesterase